MILEQGNTIRAVIAALAMTGSAVADQPKLPPKPRPTPALQARASIPDTLPEQIDMAPECERLEQLYFAGIDAVKQDDAEDLSSTLRILF